MKTTCSLLVAFMLCVQLSLQAQNAQKSTQFTVKGVVMDSVSNASVPFASLSVFKASASGKPFKRQATDVNGKFELIINGSEPLTLTIEAVGVKTKVMTITDFTKPIIDLGNVWVSSNDKMLSEVTVTAAKPLVQVDLDKISYDMNADPDAETNNTLDMLRKVPMITVDGDENIRVKGQSNFKIFMNGKETAMFSNNPAQVLKSIPANTVKRIEVITEPGAKYQAEGLAGIINIVTQSAMAGYTGSVSVTVDNYGVLQGGGYFSTKIGKWGITANLNGGQFKHPAMFSRQERNSFNNPTRKYLTSDKKGGNNGRFQQGNLSLSYEIDSLNLLTINANGWGGAYAFTNSGNVVMQNDLRDTVQAYHAYNSQSGIFGGYEGSVDYQRSFKKPDKLFTASYKLSYSPGGSDIETENKAIINYIDRKQHILSASSGSEHTLQLDYTEPFNKKHVVEAGIKYIYRLNRSNNEYNLWKAGQWQPDPDIPANGITHTNDIIGTYGSYTYKLKKFSARAGGRFEYSKIIIRNADKSEVAPKPYLNLVPSVTLSYKTTPASSIQISYTQRISRPDIYFLNPFKDNSNPNSVTQGNPNLQPEISNSFSLNYNLFTPQLNFNGSLYTSFADNSIESLSSLHGDTVFTVFRNIGKMRRAGASTYVRWQLTKAFSFYMNGSVNYMDYKHSGQGQTIANKGVTFGVHGGGLYNLPLDFSINFFGGYSSPFIRPQGKSNAYHYYGLGLSKAFLNKKLHVRLNATGFFERYIRYVTITSTDEYYNKTVFGRESPRFSVTVSYRFGEMKAQIRKTTRGIKNDDVKSGGNDQMQQGGGGGN